jgi:hypothetical protein
MAAVTPSTTRERSKMDVAGVETGEKIVAGLTGGVAARAVKASRTDGMLPVKQR